MKINRQTSLRLFLVFGWKKVTFFGLYAAACVYLYKYQEWQWMHLPWLPISVIGTAVAFYVGFKNNAAYDRTWEARKIWGAIVNSSRSWGIMVKDFLQTTHTKDSKKRTKAHDDTKHTLQQELVYRHIAWLYGLRRQLWQLKPWEHNRPDNQYHRQKLLAHFSEGTVREELAPFLDEAELDWALERKNPATQLIRRQSERLRELHQQGLISDYKHVEMAKMLVDFYTQQGKCERIKNFPLPRQYATSGSLFIYILIFLLPFGLMAAFNVPNTDYIWLTVPFTALVGWAYWMMDLIGDYAENPFEGLALDIPMTALCRTIEIDLREMLDETALPPAIQPLMDTLN